MIKKITIILLIIFFASLASAVMVNAKAGMIVKVLSQQEMEVNLGKEDGLLVGQDLTVFRMGNPIATGKIQKLEERTCLIRITENKTSDVPELGDSVARDVTSLQQANQSVQTYENQTTAPPTTQIDSNPQTVTVQPPVSTTDTYNNPPVNTTDTYNNPPVSTTDTYNQPPLTTTDVYNQQQANTTNTSNQPSSNPADIYNIYSGTPDTVDIYNNPYSNSYNDPYFDSSLGPPPVSSSYSDPTVNTYNTYNQPATNTYNQPPVSSADTATPPPVMTPPPSTNNQIYVDPSDTAKPPANNYIEPQVSYADLLRDRTQIVVIEGESSGGFNGMGSSADVLQDIFTMAFAISIGDPVYIATSAVSVATRPKLGQDYGYFDENGNTVSPAASNITGILWDEALTLSYADYMATQRYSTPEEKAQFIREFSEDHSINSSIAIQLIIDNKTAYPIGLSPFKWRVYILDGEGNRYAVQRYDNVFEGNVNPGERVEGFVYFPKVDTDDIEFHIDQVFSGNYEMEWDL